MNFRALDSSLAILQGTYVWWGHNLVRDTRTRRAYNECAIISRANIKTQIDDGHMSVYQGAMEACNRRNVLLEEMRMRSSPLGELICKLIKARATTYHKLMERYAWKEFETKYWLLNPLQQLRVRNLFNHIIRLVLCSYISCYCLDTIYGGKCFGKAKL